MSRPDFTQRDTIRRNFGAGLIAGRGVEIGAGAFPQPLPPGAAASHYDLRNAAELRALFGTETIPVRPLSDLPNDFPSGADFLIAHNVLEHSPNPIGELIRWNGFVRAGGTVVLSLPHYLYCPDAKRSVPPLAHLIHDYVTGTDGDDFVSREHSASFALGWWEDFCRAHRTESIALFAHLALDSLKDERPDFHWHAYDSDLACETAAAAAILSGTGIEFLRCWRPDHEQTVGDILIAYRILGRSGISDVAQRLADLHVQMSNCVDAATALVRRELQPLVQQGPKLLTVLLTRPFNKEGDHCFVVPVPAQFLAFVEPHMTVTVQEGGVPLGPADSVHQTIRDRGAGAFSLWGSNLYFSSSDNSDCNRNGRNYFIKAYSASRGRPLAGMTPDRRITTCGNSHCARRG